MPKARRTTTKEIAAVNKAETATVMMEFVNDWKQACERDLLVLLASNPTVDIIETQNQYKAILSFEAVLKKAIATGKMSEARLKKERESIQEG